MNEHRDAALLPTALTAQDLASLPNGSVSVIDVRTPAEYESSHIPASFSIPLHHLEEHALPLTQTVNNPIVLVCRSGLRAQQAETLLRSVDCPQVHVLTGGLAAWEAAGLPVNRGRQRWSMERQVRAVAGGLTLTGAVAGFFLWPPLGLIAAGVGGGLLTSALTDTCTMAKVLARLPYNRGNGCDVGAVLQSIARSQMSPADLS